jgi:hypothetical protein
MAFSLSKLAHLFRAHWFSVGGLLIGSETATTSATRDSERRGRSGNNHNICRPYQRIYEVSIFYLLVSAA